jgi:K+-transporting ATPase KdpF subunit
MGMWTVMTPVELVLGSIMAIALTIYLVYAMLRPEKF